MKLTQTQINLQAILSSINSNNATTKALPESNDFLSFLLETITPDSDVVLPETMDDLTSDKKPIEAVVGQDDDGLIPTPAELLAPVFIPKLPMLPPDQTVAVEAINQGVDEVIIQNTNQPKEINLPTKIEISSEIKPIKKNTLNLKVLTLENKTESNPVLNHVAAGNDKSHHYADFFTELNGLINTQLANQFPQDNSQTRLETTLQPEKFVAQDKPVMQAYELKIELLPPSVESINKEVYEAKLKIYPPELGCVTAKLKVGKNGTELIIVAENSRVQAIIEANLPQLRDGFKQADIQLMHIQVDSFTPSQKEQQHSFNQAFQKPDGLEMGEDQLQRSKAPKVNSNKLIDTYA